LSRLAHDVFGAPVSEGTLWNLTMRCHDALATVTEAIKKALIDSPVLHTDETSCRLGKRRFWMHTYCTDQLTHYAFHQKRGKVAMQEIGVLPDYKGCAVHDGLQDYFSFHNCRHGLCGVHLLRDLIFVHEQFGTSGTWAKGMIDLFLEMKSAAQSAREQGLSAVPPAELNSLLWRYDALLAQGYRHNPPPMGLPGHPDIPDVAAPLAAKGKKPKKPQTPFPLRLLDRLRDWKTCVCRFVTDIGVPFDNNQAERDLRMIKVRQKISGCFRSENGARAFCTIRGYLSTLAKQQAPLLQALVNAFQGSPLMPRSA